MKHARRSDEYMIQQWLEEGLAVRVGPYVCLYSRGNYEVRNSWLPDRVFRTSSAAVAAHKIRHGDWKQPGPTAV